MRLQEIQDNDGRTTGVYIPINEWEELKKRYKDLEELEYEEPSKEAFPGIESRMGVSGGEPYIKSTRIPVWLLEQARRLGVSEADILKSYPTLRAEDLAHAWAYIRAHRSEIEKQIEENEAA